MQTESPLHQSTWIDFRSVAEEKIRLVQTRLRPQRIRQTPRPHQEIPWIQLSTWIYSSTRHLGPFLMRSFTVSSKRWQHLKNVATPAK
jgi:hypothetical protein